MSSKGQIAEDGKGLNLERISQHFQVWVQYMYFLNPQNEALMGKVHLILSFWLIRNVIAFESSTVCCFSINYDRKHEKAKLP